MARMTCPAYSSVLTINLGAIAANYRVIAGQVSPARCAAVVKADAYGLGIGKVAPVLRDAGCTSFFVAHLSEAIVLREVIGPDGDIFVLNGIDPGCEDLCAARGFVPVLNSASQVTRWRDAARAQGRALTAALQIDSGMSRLGITPGMAADLARDSDFATDVALRLLMTHLACADQPSDPTNARQRESFLSVRRLFPDMPASIANSGGAFLAPGFGLDLVRPGIALYGVAPNECTEGLRPVVRLDARILQIREIDAGTGVGYGLDYIALDRRRLATIAIGYADGWPRSLGGAGAAWFSGKRLPIVGRVSMDSLTIDISALPPEAVAEGGFVELIGPSQSLEDVARDAGTIAYEILTRLGPRHERLYVGDDHPGASSSGARP